MKKPSENKQDEQSLQDKIMGLGEKSMRKSYYPELQKRIRELELSNKQLLINIREKEKAQIAIAENEALLLDVINSQPTGTYRLRLDKNADLSKGITNEYTFDFLSSKFCQILGVREDFFNKSPFAIVDIIHPDDILGFIDANNKALMNFASYSWEGRVVNGSEEKWIRMLSHPRLLSNGDKVWTGIIIDLTERIKAEEEMRLSEERFRLIFDNSPIGIISYDDKGIIKACNGYLAEITATDRSKLLGTDILCFHQKVVVKAVKKALQGHKVSFTGNFQLAGKTEPVQVSLQFAPIFDDEGKVKGGVGIIENLSEHQRNQRLEQEIVIARKSAEFKQNFLANMSHEIRTPLTGIEGMANILSQTPLNEQQQDYLNTIISSSQNLREIINQILDYSKIEAGQMMLKVKPFKISELGDKIKRLLTSLCRDKIPFHIIIPQDLPEYIATDEQKIFQVVTNFISNAVKYAPQGLITVEFCQIAYRKTDKHRFMIKVTDQGPGISEEKQKVVFTPFSQLEQDDMRTVEGTGLGLSISREMAKILGGTIGLKSEVGKGTTFWFTFNASIPDTIPADPSTEEEKEHHPETPSLRILLVEDKKVNQKVISLMLQSLGHTIHVADNGLMAVEIYKPGVYDLILMDIQMPVMDGITATNTIRAKFPQTPPIVGLSANSFEGDKEKYMNMGMDDYITKPVNKQDINKLVRKLFC